MAPIPIGGALTDRFSAVEQVLLASEQRARVLIDRQLAS